jgi:transcriptional regulator with XRE-family HTH domain
MEQVPDTPLRVVRKAKGVNLRTLAKRCKISESQMSRIERDGTDSLKLAVELSKFSGLPVETFMRREDAAA